MFRLVRRCTLASSFTTSMSAPPFPFHTFVVPCRRRLLICSLVFSTSSRSLASSRILHLPHWASPYVPQHECMRQALTSAHGVPYTQSEQKFKCMALVTDRTSTCLSHSHSSAYLVQAKKSKNTLGRSHAHMKATHSQSKHNAAGAVQEGSYRM